MTDKRLTGIRTPYAEMPSSLRAWVDQQLGSPVMETIPRTGGMSPAVAATVVGRDGSRAFAGSGDANTAIANPSTRPIANCSTLFRMINTINCCPRAPSAERTAISL